MSKPNSFRALQEETERDFNRSNAQFQEKVKAEVWGSLGVLRLIGQIVEMYLPKVVDVFIVASGGSASKNKDKYSDAPSLGGLNRPSEIKPGNPEEFDID